MYPSEMFPKLAALRTVQSWTVKIGSKLSQSKIEEINPFDCQI